jgi:hypothetical protein
MTVAIYSYTARFLTYDSKRRELIMKKSAFVLMALCGLLTFASSALALTVNSGLTDVGAVDIRIDQSPLLSGDAAELDWVRSILGNDISFVTKHDNLTSVDWKQTSESGTWAFNLQDSPDYFLVKTGDNGTNNFVDYLFNNLDMKSWAVLDLDTIYVTQVSNIDKVSHISDFNEVPDGSPAPVPEPATLLLLGVGMFGLAMRKKMRSHNA